MSQTTQERSRRSTGIFQREVPAHLVLKLLPDRWLLAEVMADAREPVIRKAASESLPRLVDPNRINLELEVVQEALIALVDRQGWDGRDVCIVLPSSCSAARSVTVPFDLSKKADVKEYLSSATDKEFWQEFEPEVQDVKQPLFVAQSLAPGEEEGSSQMLMAWSAQDVLNKYIELALTARLKPIALIPEQTAILNALHPRLERLEKEGFVGVLHLARGRSRLMAMGPERLAVARLHIQELDEELIDEIEFVESVDGDFWAEVGARLGSALRQALLYLRENEAVPPLRSVYVICDYPRADNLMQLLRQHAGQIHLRSWNLTPAFMDRSSGWRALSGELPCPGVWVSLLGGGMQGLQPARLQAQPEDVPHYQLNLHPQQTRLQLNRQYSAIARKTGWSGLALLVTYAVWVAVAYAPQYLQLERSVASGASLKAEHDQLSQNLQGLKTRIQAQEALARQYVRAAQDASWSKLVLNLPAQVPPGVELTELVLWKESTVDRIDIKGLTTHGAYAQTLLQNINSLSLLKEAALAIEGPKDGAIGFSITGKSGEVH